MNEGIEEAVNRMQEEAAMPLYDKLPPAEAAFHDALKGVAAQYGKFGAGEAESIYVNYQSPSENMDAKKGVKCGNCSFYKGEGQCAIVAQMVEANGLCRLAAIPPGYVTYG
jgi:hypothetical protein